MKDNKIFIDDRVIIPEEIKNMNSEERRSKIRQLEEEARIEKRRLLRNNPDISQTPIQ